MTERDRACIFYPTDIDECVTGTHNCHVMAHCYNSPGSFSCECWKNFTGDGVLCEPMGEWPCIFFFSTCFVNNCLCAHDFTRVLSLHVAYNGCKSYLLKGVRI